MDAIGTEEERRTVRTLQYKEHIDSKEPVFTVFIEDLIWVFEPKRETWDQLNRQYMLEDMRVNGQRTPILVDKARKGNGSFIKDKWKVVQGQHRIACAKQLGWKTIKAQRVYKPPPSNINSEQFEIKTVMIPIEQLHPNEKHTIKTEYRKALLEDIRKNGIKYPIYVRWDSTNKYYVVLDGNHRYWVGVLLELREIPCRIHDRKTAAAVIELMRKERARGWECQ